MPVLGVGPVGPEDLHPVVPRSSGFARTGIVGRSSDSGSAMNRPTGACGAGSPQLTMGPFNNRSIKHGAEIRLGTCRMRVFVAGASGAIGQPLIVELVRQGHTVTGMTHSETSARKLVAMAGRRSGGRIRWAHRGTGPATITGRDRHRSTDVLAQRSFRNSGRRPRRSEAEARGRRKPPSPAQPAGCVDTSNNRAAFFSKGAADWLTRPMAWR